MAITVGDIKTFTLITGMEILGKVTEISDGVYSVKEAFAVQLHPQKDSDGNQVGVRVVLAPLTPFAMQNSKSGGLDIELYFGTVLLATDPPEEVVEQYSNQTGSILTPSSRKIIA